MATQPANRVSLEEYLELEGRSAERHEYWQGEMFAMAGGTFAHAALAMNAAIELGSQLRARGSQCRVLGADMRIRTGQHGLYSYADAVVCCPPEQVDGNTLLNPIVIVEVLSDSTENYDRGRKFEEYRKIPSFLEYLVIAQKKRYVEHHVRGESGVWTMREYREGEGVIALRAIDVSLLLAELYAGVEFESV